MATDAAETSALRARAAQSIQDGQLDAAQGALEKLIGLAPDDLSARLQLADVMTVRGAWRASGTPLLGAIAHLPADPVLLRELLRRLLERGEVIATRQCLDFMDALPGLTATAVMTQAHLRFALGEIATATALAERARAMGADAADDQLLHARLLQAAGQFDSARDLLMRCVQGSPDYANAVVALANLHAWAPSVGLLELADTRLQRLPAVRGDRARQFLRAGYEYLRFMALDDDGRHEEAWAALANCNDLMHDLEGYDAHGTEALTTALMCWDGASGPPPQAAADDSGPRPIFIVGMPRSGTTLLDHMLSAHSQIASAGEILDFIMQLHHVADVRPSGVASLRSIAGQGTHIDLRAVGERYLQQTQWRAGSRRYYIDKWPLNFQIVGFIRRALPQAIIVHITRSPMDVCFSNLKAMFDAVAEYSYDQRSLAHCYGQYLRLAGHWRTHLPDAMLEVRYEDLVREPAATLRTILARCGLELEDACLHPERNEAPVASPSNTQVREAIRADTDGQWKAYAQHLQPLQQALADLQATGS